MTYYSRRRPWPGYGRHHRIGGGPSSITFLSASASNGPAEAERESHPNSERTGEQGGAYSPALEAEIGFGPLAKRTLPAVEHAPRTPPAESSGDQAAAITAQAEGVGTEVVAPGNEVEMVAAYAGAAAVSPNAVRDGIVSTGDVGSYVDEQAENAV